MSAAYQNLVRHQKTKIFRWVWYKPWFCSKHKACSLRKLTTSESEPEYTAIDESKYYALVQKGWICYSIKSKYVYLHNNALDDNRIKWNIFRQRWSEVWFKSQNNFDVKAQESCIKGAADNMAPNKNVTGQCLKVIMCVFGILNVRYARSDRQEAIWSCCCWGN